MNIPSFEIPFIDSESVSPLTGFEKDPLPLQMTSLEQFIQTVKGQTNFCEQIIFST